MKCCIIMNNLNEAQYILNFFSFVNITMKFLKWKIHMFFVPMYVGFALCFLNMIIVNLQYFHDIFYMNLFVYILFNICRNLRNSFSWIFFWKKLKKIQYLSFWSIQMFILLCFNSSKTLVSVKHILQSSLISI